MDREGTLISMFSKILVKIDQVLTELWAWFQKWNHNMEPIKSLLGVSLNQISRNLTGSETSESL